MAQGEGRPASEALGAIASDRRRGAAEIADSLLGWAEGWGSGEAGPDDPAAASRELERVARSQSAMAPILRIVNDLLLELERREGTDDADAARRAVGKAAGSWRSRLAAAAESLTLHLRRSFEGAATIYTYSASSTVREALRAHHDAGNWFQVVISEARPGNEGSALARQLAEHGVPVRLGTDAWLWGEICEEEGVLALGADALTSRWWVNKTGTAPLAERARAHGISVVAAADTSKWLPPALAELPRNYDRDPDEIAVRPPASMEVANPYFEEIPYSALDHLITERGPTRPRDLRTGEIPVASALR